MELNPVAALENMGIRCKKIPVYNYSVNEDDNLNKIFCCELEFLGRKKHGFAVKKKEAKIVATKKMLNDIIENNYLEDELAKHQAKHPVINEEKINHVGFLQNICLKQKRSLPIYKDVDAFGPANAKVFVVECQFDNELKEKANGRTKQDAKHNAAMLMIKTLREKKIINDSEIEEKKKVKTIENLNTQNTKTQLEEIAQGMTPTVLDDSQLAELKIELSSILDDIDDSKELNEARVNTIDDKLTTAILPIGAEVQYIPGHVGDLLILTAYISTVPGILVSDASKNLLKLRVSVYRQVIEALLQRFSIKE